MGIEEKLGARSTSCWGLGSSRELTRDAGTGASVHGEPSERAGTAICRKRGDGFGEARGRHAGRVATAGRRSRSRRGGAAADVAGPVFSLKFEAQTYRRSPCEVWRGGLRSAPRLGRAHLLES